MKNTHCAIIMAFMLVCFGNSFAQNFKWAVSIGGSAADLGTAVTYDNDGNVYATGSFVGTVDFDPGPGTYNLTSAGADDVFVTKLDANGNLIWAKQMGGGSFDYGTSICVDDLGNVYTIGYFRFTADFDPGPGVFNLTSTLNGIDISISKLDNSGNFVWAKDIGGEGVNYGATIQLDQSGNIYIAGSFDQTTDFDPSAETFNLTSFGFTDVFVLKLDPSGNFTWAKQIGGIDTQIICSAMNIDGSGNIYMIGSFIDLVDFDPSINEYPLTSTLFSNDIYISKLDQDGNFVWAKQIGGNTDDLGLSITTDNLGDVYLTGHFSGEVDFDPGNEVYSLASNGNSETAFISKLDEEGNFIWAKLVNAYEGISMCVDAENNLHTAGRFGGTADLDPGAGISNITSAGGFDVFILKLNPDGNFIDARRMGGTQDDLVVSIVSNLLGDMYITGRFKSTCDFNPETEVFNLTSAGDFDAFIVRLSEVVTGKPEIPTTLNELKVFPIPTDKSINFSQPINVVITNIRGQLVVDQKNTSSIDLSGYPSGIYFYCVTDEFENVYQRGKILKN